MLYGNNCNSGELWDIRNNLTLMHSIFILPRLLNYGVPAARRSAIRREALTHSPGRGLQPGRDRDESFAAEEVGRTGPGVPRSDACQRPEGIPSGIGGICRIAAIVSVRK